MSRLAPGRRYPVLPPLWLEHPSVERMARIAGAPPLPDWRRLLVQAEGFGLTEYAKQLHPSRIPLNPEHSQDFLILRSVLEIGDAIRAHGAAAGMPPYEAGVQAYVEDSLYALAMWRRWRRVYVLDEGTFALLARTALPRIPSAVLRMPVPAFHLVVPRGAFAYTPPSGVRHEVLGATVVADGGLDADGCPRAVRVWTNAAPPGRTATGEPRAPDTQLFEATVDIQPARDLAATAAAIVGLAPTLRPDLEDEGPLELDSLAKVVLGFLLYLQSDHPHLEPVPPAPREDTSRLRNPAKVRRAEERNARVSRLGYVYVGHPDDRRLAEAPALPPGVPESEASPAGAAGRRLTRQVWVSGHFRDQPVGEGLRERRLVWVRPHVKGPDLAEGLALTGGYVQPARHAQPMDAPRGAAPA